MEEAQGRALGAHHEARCHTTALVYRTHLTGTIPTLQLEVEPAAPRVMRAPCVSFPQRSTLHTLCRITGQAGGVLAHGLDTILILQPRVSSRTQAPGNEALDLAGISFLARQRVGKCCSAVWALGTSESWDRSASAAGRVGKSHPPIRSVEGGCCLGSSSLGSEGAACFICRLPSSAAASGCQPGTFTPASKLDGWKP